MTFWLDAHLSPDLAAWLGARFKVIAKALNEIGLRDAEDEAIHAAARRFGDIVIVTCDHDFVELVRRKGSPPQVLWLNVRNGPTIALQARLALTFAKALELLLAGEPLVEIS